MFSSDYRSDDRNFGRITPMEAFWDKQRDGLKKVRSQLLKRNASRASRLASRRSSGAAAARDLNGGRSVASSVPSRRTSLPTPPAQRSSPAQLPRIQTPPRHEKFHSKSRLRGTKYDIIPPVRAAQRRNRPPPPPPPPPKDYDSWGESESDESDETYYHYHHPRYPQPMPIYTQIPQPIFTQVPMYYPPRMRKRKRRKPPRRPAAPPAPPPAPVPAPAPQQPVIVAQRTPRRRDETPATVTRRPVHVFYETARMDQATNTVENKQTQYDSGNEFTVDRGVDAMNGAESRGGLRDNAHVLLNTTNRLDPREVVMERQQFERPVPVEPIPARQNPRPRAKTHRTSRGIKPVSTADWTATYRRGGQRALAPRPHGTAPAAATIQRTLSNDDDTRNDTMPQSESTWEPWRADERSVAPPGGNEAELEATRIVEESSEYSYDEDSNDATIQQPKYYYEYTSTRPNYLSEVFDESTNPVLQRYRYWNPHGSKRVAWADEVDDYYEFPKEIQALRHLLNHNDFAEMFVDGFVEEYLEEEIPEFLLDWLTYIDSLPADHPWFVPSMHYIEDLILDEVILMSKDIVLELAQQTVNDYLNKQMDQKRDPLEDFLDSIFGDVIYTLGTETVKEGMRELADEYMENALVYDILMEAADSIISEDAEGILEDAIMDVTVEDIIDEHYLTPHIDDQSDSVAREILTHYDTKQRRKMIKELAEMANKKLLDSMLLEEILSSVAHQGKIWTQSHYSDKLFNELILDVLLGQYFDVPNEFAVTADDKALRKLHEKMVTDVALDVLLDELNLELDEDLAMLDDNERGENNPDPGLPEDVHQWLCGNLTKQEPDDENNDEPSSSPTKQPVLSLEEQSRNLELT
ncbi:uncharacterized protein LOC141910992 [Tubulanus polymorphus]|uniref:uncharacterized protein LOC141910992 n=1 Tax=Tubulanus polymorphus TaxID=672921 RepID=UPI003DA1FBAB